MAELSILEPTVLTGLIEKFTAPPESVATAMFTRQSYPEVTAKWDVIQGSRERATPTLPNREGKLVSQLGVGQKTASFIYVREKKAFEPTTLRWLRTPGELSAKNAEAAVRREVVDLNNRLERLVESYCWEALKGQIVIDEPDIKATVDYGFDVTHTPTAGTLWDDTTNADIIGNVKAWQKMVAEDSGFPLTDVYLSSDTMELVWKNTGVRYLFTDRFKEEYYSKGSISGLLGLNWHIFDGGYVDNGSFVPYIPSTHVIMIAGGGNPFLLLEGLSADEDAPTSHTGKFSKTWESKDPSGRFILLEYNFIPVIQRVENVVYAEVSAS